MKNLTPFFAFTTLLTGSAALYLGLKPQEPATSQPNTPKASLSQQLGGTLRESQKPERIPYLVKQLVAADAEQDERLQAVRDLPEELNQSEFEALVQLLRQEHHEGMSDEEWFVVANEIMAILRRDAKNDAQAGRALAQLIPDEALDPVIRDYAAQHLGSWYLQNSTRPERNPETQAQVLQDLVGAIAAPRNLEHTVLGTSLLTLSMIHDQQPEFINEATREQLKQHLTPIINAEINSSLANQVASIQAAARLHLDALHPTIRQIAAGESGQANLRLSAIAALRYYAKTEDRPLLEKLAAEKSPYQFAAQAALQPITNPTATAQ